MKLPLISKIALVSSLTLTNFVPQLAVYGSPFEQQEVNQEEFIAIAKPYGNNKYNLLILRQIPGQRQCWQEMNSNPVTIEPLLLNFDFTGSCQRNTDSNGYSIRVAQEDYGLDYLLRIVERDGELVLVGTHRSDPNQPEIIIGRTHGLAPGFLKIDLDPSWRFTRRAYNGQTLGHVYLTADDKTAINTPTPSRDENTSFETETGEPITEITFTAGKSSSGTASPVAKQPSASPNPNPLPSPPTPNSSTPTTPPPLPAFSDLPPLSPPTTQNANDVVPPPSRNNLGEVVGSLSRPTSSKMSQSTTASGYRVIVAANDSQDQYRVRSLYPDAFPTSYNGRSMLQVGLFSSRDNAQKAYQSLESAGLDAIIIP